MFLKVINILETCFVYLQRNSLQSAGQGTVEVIMTTFLKLSEEKQRTHVHINDTGHRQDKNDVSHPNIDNPIASYLLHTYHLSLIHISEPTRLLSISYAVFCLK